MNKKTFYLSDYQEESNEIIETLAFHKDHVLSYQKSNWDFEIHDWITDLFKSREIGLLIIPLSLTLSPDENLNTKGLDIALHIRLNYELTLKERCIPIIIISDFSLENIIKQNNFDSYSNPQYLLFTQGIHLVGWDSEDIIKNIATSKSISEEYYFNDFINKVTVSRKYDVGKHDIANAWGCFRIAQVTGLKEFVFNNSEVSKSLKSLYSKYLISRSESFNNTKFLDLDPVKCIGRKVLFIDDQADEGWAALFSRIFKNAGSGFLAIDSSKYKNQETKRFTDFQGFYNDCLRCKEQDWDLIIIDLRLHPETEDLDDSIIQPTELSGYKLIDEFLKTNEGTQIIVATASNKIWNVNTALERGAYSYYIKESPEYNYTNTETKKYFENFKADVNECFKRNFLREIYNSWKNTKDESSNQNHNFILESNTSLEIAWQQIKNNFLDFGFLTLFQVIERYADDLFQEDDRQSNTYSIEGTTVIGNKSSTDEREWILKHHPHHNGDYFSNETIFQKSNIKPTTLYKISCLLHVKYQKDDIFLRNFGKLNKLRNKIAHEGASNFSTKNNLIEILNILKEIRSSD